MRTSKLQRKWLLTVAAWTVSLLIFFPVFWLVLTSFKTETEAISRVPHLLFAPTVQSYREVQQRADYAHFAWNSIVVSVGSTLLALLLAIPASYAFAFLPTKRTQSTLLWMLSTRMMPAVGVLVPVYLIYRELGLLDSKLGLLLLDTMLNLPIIVWMLYTFFKDVPREVLEAGRMDGAGPLRELGSILLPLSLPGIVSTGLLARHSYVE